MTGNATSHCVDARRLTKTLRVGTTWTRRHPGLMRSECPESRMVAMEPTTRRSSSVWFYRIEPTGCAPCGASRQIRHGCGDSEGSYPATRIANPNTSRTSWARRGHRNCARRTRSASTRLLALERIA